MKVSGENDDGVRWTVGPCDEEGVYVHLSVGDGVPVTIEATIPREVLSKALDEHDLEPDGAGPLLRNFAVSPEQLEIIRFALRKLSDLGPAEALLVDNTLCQITEDW